MKAIFLLLLAVALWYQLGQAVEHKRSNRIIRSLTADIITLEAQKQSASDVTFETFQTCHMPPCTSSNLTLTNNRFSLQP